MFKLTLSLLTRFATLRIAAAVSGARAPC